MTALMRNSLCHCLKKQNIPEKHAGLWMQRGLRLWDEGNDKPTKSDLINKISGISASSLYQLAYERWLTNTADKQRFAFTAAKTYGRLYTGMSSATALETGLTTHHTYGMPMLAGSSVKGAVASFAQRVGIDNNICQVLFGDEDNAGALVWHDAWWIPNSGAPFVAEIVTTHHQKYYGSSQNKADELEDPIPNQQIACQGSFYFVVECSPEATAWATFANTLLMQMLEQQGIGSKTASGYGYFELDQIQVDNINRHHKDAQERAKAVAQAKLLDSLPAHKRLVEEWSKILQADVYKISDQAHTDLYNKLVVDLQSASENDDFSAEQKKFIAEKLSFNTMTKTWKQANWLNSKREKEIKPILKKLRGE